MSVVGPAAGGLSGAAAGEHRLAGSSARAPEALPAAGASDRPSDQMDASTASPSADAPLNPGGEAISRTGTPDGLKTGARGEVSYPSGARPGLGVTYISSAPAGGARVAKPVCPREQLHRLSSGRKSWDPAVVRSGLTPPPLDKSSEPAVVRSGLTPPPLNR